ncbi:MAG: ATP-binding protein [Planctomycetota bacterium]
MSRPELHVICGLPGTGKTTLAKRLEANLPGVRLCPDEWITAVFPSRRHGYISDTYRDAIEELQWRLGKRMLAANCSVIIEWGTWGRRERDRLRDEGRAVGAKAVLHYLDAPFDEIRRRLLARNDRLPEGEIYMPPEGLDGWLAEWSALIERPSADELTHWEAAYGPGLG